MCGSKATTRSTLRRVDLPRARHRRRSRSSWRTRPGALLARDRLGEEAQDGRAAGRRSAPGGSVSGRKTTTTSGAKRVELARAARRRRRRRGTRGSGCVTPGAAPSGSAQASKKVDCPTKAMRSRIGGLGYRPCDGATGHRRGPRQPRRGPRGLRRRGRRGARARRPRGGHHLPGRARAARPLPARRRGARGGRRGRRDGAAARAQHAAAPGSAARRPGARAPWRSCAGCCPTTTSCCARCRCGARRSSRGRAVLAVEVAVEEHARRQPLPRRLRAARAGARRRGGGRPGRPRRRARRARPPAQRRRLPRGAGARAARPASGPPRASAELPA